jgi:uncharacterized protein YjiS (DUF1127 family)
MEQTLHGEFRLCPIGHRYTERHTAAGSQNATAIALVLPSTGPKRRRTAARDIALQMVIRQFIAAIRRWRERARARQQLHELSDHTLKDIGLRRENVG